MGRRRVLQALAAVPPCELVSAWWLIGDLSEPGDPASHDHLLRPLAISPGAERVLGATATALLVVAVVVARGSSREERRATWPLVAAAAFVALAGRVMTAGVGGANIGGGMLMMVGPFVLLPLLVVGARRWYRVLQG